VPWEGQQAGFPGGDETTHSLVAEQCHGRVSRLVFREETRRRIRWWRNSAIGGSAGWISGRRQNNAQAGGGTAPWEGQQAGFLGGDKTTYILVVEQHHRRVSRLDFWEEMRRRTSWSQNSTMEGSAGWFSRRRQDDALAGGRTAPWEGQHAGFPGGDKMTHKLVAEQRHRRVSRLDFREGMRRRTCWWQNSAMEGSAG